MDGNSVHFFVDKIDKLVKTKKDAFRRVVTEKGLKVHKKFNYFAKTIELRFILCYNYEIVKPLAFYKIIQQDFETKKVA